MNKIKKDKKIVIIIISVLIICVGIICVLYANGAGNSDDVVIESAGFDEAMGEVNSGAVAGKGDSANKVPNESENGVDKEENMIYVHIIGEINNPGVLKLKEGHRIIDAINAAGGATENADLSRVNLAFVLSDGQKVNIPNVNNKDEDFEYVTFASGRNVIVDGGGTLNSRNGKVNINTASQTELETLNGIGPSLASKIISYREANGKFKKIEDLMNVSGIGENKFEGIRNEIIV